MRNSGPSPPTEVELQILRILWELGPCPVREMHARLPEPAGNLLPIPGVATRPSRASATSMDFWRSTVDRAVRPWLLLDRVQRLFDRNWVERPLSTGSVAGFGLLALALIGAGVWVTAIAGEQDSKAGATATLEDGSQITLLGVSNQPSENRPWWKPEGGAIPGDPLASRWKYSPTHVQDAEGERRELALEITGSNRDVHAWVDFAPGEKLGLWGTYWNFQEDAQSGKKVTLIRAATAAFPKGAKQGDVLIRLALGTWHPYQVIDLKQEPPQAADNQKDGTVQLRRVRELTDGSTQVDLAYPKSFELRAHHEVVGEDRDGNQVDVHGVTVGDAGARGLIFRCPQERLAKVRIRFHWYTHAVTFRDVSLDPNQRARVNTVVRKLEPPADGLTICGLDVSRYPSTFDKGALPGFLVPHPEKPGQKQWAANLLAMPIYKSDPYATLDYPVGSGHFFVSVREGQRTRTYGPITGDPFDLLGLDQSMHEKLRLAVEFPNDALLRLRQLLSRNDANLCRRGFSMVKELPIPAERRTLDGLIEVLEHVKAQGTDASFKIEADAALARVRDLKAQSVANWESRRVLLDDKEYSAGNDREPSSQIVWGKPHPVSGLQVGFSLKALPDSQTKPDINGFPWPFGDPLTATVFVRAQGDALVKFTSTSRADEGLRLWLADEAGKRHECGIGSFTSPLQEKRFRLSNGQWIELKEIALTATQLLPDVEEPRFHSGFLVRNGQYSLHVELTIAGFERGGISGPITIPAAGEWTGELTSGSVPVSIAVRRP